MFMAHLDFDLKGYAKLASFQDCEDIQENTLTLFRLGGGGGGGGGGRQCASYRIFPCCAKTVCSRLTKISDF